MIPIIESGVNSILAKNGIAFSKPKGKILEKIVAHYAQTVLTYAGNVW